MSAPFSKPPSSRFSWRLTVLLMLAAAVFAYPFLWMLLAAFKSNAEIFDPRRLAPSAWDVQPIRRLLGGEWFPFWRVYLNSLLVALTQASLATLVTSLAGYAFATSRSAWVRGLFPIALVVIVLPVQTLAIPLFSWVNTLGLMDRLPGVILPGAVSGIGLIWFTQVFRHVPAALREAARLDGAGEWRIWWLLVPTQAPALISYGLIHFILAWHDHLLPLLMLNSATQQTLPVAIAGLYGSSLRYPYAALMAASVLSILPTAIVFGICFRRFKTALADALIH